MCVCAWVLLERGIEIRVRENRTICVSVCVRERNREGERERKRGNCKLDKEWEEEEGRAVTYYWKVLRGTDSKMPDTQGRQYKLP